MVIPLFAIALRNLSRLPNSKIFFFTTCIAISESCACRRAPSTFWRALFASYVKQPLQLPDDYRAKLECESAHRVVADYIANLTDRSALHEFQQLFDPITRP